MNWLHGWLATARPDRAPVQSRGQDRDLAAIRQTPDLTFRQLKERERALLLDCLDELNLSEIERFDIPCDQLNGRMHELLRGHGVMVGSFGSRVVWAMGQTVLPVVAGIVAAGFLVGGSVTFGMQLLGAFGATGLFSALFGRQCSLARESGYKIFRDYVVSTAMPQLCLKDALRRMTAQAVLDSQQQKPDRQQRLEQTRKAQQGNQRLEEEHRDCLQELQHELNASKKQFTGLLQEIEELKRQKKAAEADAEGFKNSFHALQAAMQNKQEQLAEKERTIRRQMSESERQRDRACRTLESQLQELKLQKQEIETRLESLKADLQWYETREYEGFSSLTESMSVAQIEMERQRKFEEQKRSDDEMSRLLECNNQLQEELDLLRCTVRDSSTSSDSDSVDGDACKTLQEENTRLQQEISRLETELHSMPVLDDLRQKIEQPLREKINSLQSEIEALGIVNKALGIEVADQTVELEVLRKLELEKKTLSQLRIDLNHEQLKVAQERFELEETLERNLKENENRFSRLKRAVEQAESCTRSVESQLDDQLQRNRELQDKVDALEAKLARQEELSSQMEASLKRRTPVSPNQCSGLSHPLAVLPTMANKLTDCRPGMGDRDNYYRQIFQDLELKREALAAPGREDDRNRFYLMVYALSEFVRVSVHFWLQNLDKNEAGEKAKSFDITLKHRIFSNCPGSFDEIQKRVAERQEGVIRDEDYVDALRLIKRLMTVIKTCHNKTALVIARYAYHISENMVEPEAAQGLYQLTQEENLKTGKAPGLDDEGYDLSVLFTMCSPVLRNFRKMIT